MNLSESRVGREPFEYDERGTLNSEQSQSQKPKRKKQLQLNHKELFRHEFRRDKYNKLLYVRNSR